MRILLAILLCVGSLAAASTPKEPLKTDLFHGGEGGYKTYRIPALVVTVKGTLLAFCAARKDFSDWAEINIALRRSTNGGKDLGAGTDHRRAGRVHSGQSHSHRRQEWNDSTSSTR